MAGKGSGIVVLLAVAATAAGCGAKESNHLKAAPTETKPGEQLRGTYTAKIPKAVLPPKIAASSPQWTLTISATGAAPSSSTPSITIANPKSGVLEKSRVGVETDTLLIHDEFCNATRGSVDSLYRYRLSGKQLRISKYKNGCPDKITETVLTTKPWTKTKPGS